MCDAHRPVVAQIDRAYQITTRCKLPSSSCVGPHFETVDSMDNATIMHDAASRARPVTISAGGVELAGDLTRIRAARGLVVVTCAGNARRSAEQALIERLNRAGIATLRIDLLSQAEATADAAATEPVRQDVELLAQRVRVVDRWADTQRRMQGVVVGYYGSGSAACAALRRASSLGSTREPAFDALVICEVKSDFEPSCRARQSQPPEKEPDAELIADLFRTWLSWESNPGGRPLRSRRAHDRPSAAP